MKVMHPVDIDRICAVWFDHVANDVRAAMNHAWLKHGEPTKDVVRGATTLCEEAGEVAKEALDATRAVPTGLVDVPPEDELRIRMRARVDRNRVDALWRMHHELMQVAGYAILLAVQLEGTIREAVDGKRS